jgi:hypothetical protein
MGHAACSRFQRKQSKALVENAWALTVHRSRDADPDSCSPSFRVSVGARREWDAVARPVGEMEFRVHFDPDPDYADDTDPYAKEVQVAESTCHFGGRRYWLVCPNPRCRRRTARLFRVDDGLTCRNCAKLSYRSQRERAPLRALRRAQATRRRIGGTGSSLERFPDRPKFMHRMTYLKLLSKTLFWEKQYYDTASDQIRGSAR